VAQQRPQIEEALFFMGELPYGGGEFAEFIK
jgi:hypothetical protein